MSIVEINLQAGVHVVESDLLEMQKENVFPGYEMSKYGQGFVSIYLDTITYDETKLIFRVEDAFSDNDSSRQPATIKIYDYYKPERSCIKQYSISSNHGPGIKYTCMEGSDQCQCTQSCMKQVNQELFEMALKFVSEKDAAKRRKLPKPVDTLMDYACNFKKANFVVKVNVTDVSNNPKRDVIFAHAVILEALLQGRDALREGADMEFEWDVTCSHPELTLGKIYYIIGKDGTTFNVNGMTRVRYDLMGTALVIDPEFKPLLRVLMHSFVTELKINKGCLN